MAEDEEEPMKKIKLMGLNATVFKAICQENVTRIPLNRISIPLYNENVPKQKNLVDLPNEVLLEIVKYLPLADRKSLRLMSERFYEICNSTEFLNAETFVFFNKYLKNLVIETLERSKRKWFCLDFNSISFNRDNWLFESKITQKIHSLNFNACSFDDGLLEDLIINCENLSYLRLNLDDFEGCKKIVIPDGENIVRSNLVSLEIIVSSFSWLSESFMPRIIRIFPHLKHFRIDITDDDMLRNGCWKNFPSIFSSICRGIHELAEQLEELSLDFQFTTFVDGPLSGFLNELSKYLFSLRRLRKLSLKFWEIPIYILGRLSELQCLESLELEQITHLSSPAAFLTFLSNELPNLKHVYCTFDFDEPFTSDISSMLMNVHWKSFHFIADLRSSISFFLYTSCEKLVDGCLNDCLSNKSLRTLSLKRHCFDDSVQLSFFAHLPNLEHLDINIRREEYLASICKYNPNLKRLMVDHIKYCFRQGDAADNFIKGSIEFPTGSFPRLEYLRIRCLNSDFIRKTLFRLDFPQLSYLSLIGGGRNLKVKIFLPVLVKLCNLEVLCLTNFLWSKDESDWKLLSQLSANLKRLRSLCIYSHDCKQMNREFTESEYRGLFQSFPNLRVVFHEVYRDTNQLLVYYVKDGITNEVEKVDVRRTTSGYPALRKTFFT